MVSGLLKIMGINMGENIDVDNNEDLDFHKTREPLKKLIKSSSFGHQKKIKEMGQLIQTKNINDVWGWKDPLSFTYFDKIDQFLRNVHCIMIFRDPLAIAQKEVQSGFHGDLSKTLEMIIERRYRQILNCMRYIEKKQYPLLFISYERALRQKTELIDTLSQFLDVDLSTELQETCQEYIKADRITGRLKL